MPACGTAQFGDFVERTYGTDAWKQALLLSGMQEPIDHVSYPYHHDVIYELLQATAQAVHSDAADIARAFGRFCFKVSQGSDFRRLVTGMGHSLLDFLTNINNFHVVLSFGWGEDSIPAMTVEEVTSTSLTLHYRCMRPGLGPLLVGLCEAVAREVFGTWINFKPLALQEDSGAVDHHEAWHVTFQSQEEQLDRWAAANALKGQARYSPEPALFHALFPHHILLDRNLRIVQLGAALLNPRPCTPTPSPSPCATPSRSPLSPSSSSSSSRLPPSGGPAIGAPAHMHFEIVSPPHISGGVFTHLDSVASVGAWDLQRLAGLAGSRVVLRIRLHGGAEAGRGQQQGTGENNGGSADMQQEQVPLGGQLLHGSFHPTHMYTPDGLRGLLFVGSEATAPVSLDAFVQGGSRFSDVPAYDLSPCLLASGPSVDAIPSDLLVKLQMDKADLEMAKQRLEVNAEKSASELRRLRKTSVEALSKARRNSKTFDSGSPQEVVLKILENIMAGSEVDMMQVFEVYDAIVTGGHNMLRPVNVLQKLRSFDTNQDVNKGLMDLLLVHKEEEDDEGWSDWDAEWDMAKAAKQLARDKAQAVDKQESHLGSLNKIAGIAGMWKKVRNHATGSGEHASEALLALAKGPTDQVHQLLAKVDDWGFDMFELDRRTGGHPLSTLVFALMKKQHLVPGRNEISETRLARFLCKMEEGYPDNPYHCRIHAADVARNLYVLMTRGGVARQAFQHDSDMALLIALTAAVIHDYQHRGLNNDFLIKSSDMLAVLYNDRSPLENHHVAAAFTLMHEDEFDFLKNVPPKAKASFRKMVIEMVLATDMKQHFAQLSLFNTKFSTPTASAAANTAANTAANGGPLGATASRAGSVKGVASRAGSVKRLTSNMSLARLSSRMAGPPMDEDTRSLVMQMSLKCADLGHLASPPDVHVKWVQRLEEEFFRQGDKEAAANLPVSPLMDRKKEGVAVSQKGFFSIVVMPQFQAFCSAFKECAPLLEAVKRNEAQWKT